MPQAEINNISCYYEVHGKGRPLMLVGGLSSDCQTWKLVVDKLKKDFQVIVFDNRGVGRTQYPRGSFDIPIMTKDALALLDHLKIEKADILGHSMGGYIAQEMAITCPDRVNNLMLASTAAFTSARNKFLFSNMVGMLEKDIPHDLFLKEFMCWLFAPEFFNGKVKRTVFIQYVLNAPYRQTIDGFRRQVKAYSAYNSYDRLKKIKAKTLVISGRRDLLITPDEVQLLASRISNARLEYIEDVAHVLPIEDPKIFIEHIRAFNN
jgi:pimeloyl-ACP methyl ester carboxylesterase